MKQVATHWRVEWVHAATGVVSAQTYRTSMDAERYVDQLLQATDQPFSNIGEIRSFPVTYFESEGTVRVRYVRPVFPRKEK